MLDISKYEAKSLKSEAAILKIAAEIGTGNLTDVSVFERFATFMYAVGVAHKANKVNGEIDAAKIFEAFNTPFRTGAGSLRKELSDNSIKTWVSAFGAFAEAGKFAPYDMGPIVEKALALDKQAYTSRGAKVRKVMADHKDDAPNAAELDAIFNPVGKEDKNPLLTLAKRWASTCDDARVAKNDADAMAQAKANPRQRVAMLAVQEAIKALAEACAVTKTANGMTAAEEMAKLKAEIDAASQPNGTVN